MKLGVLDFFSDIFNFLKSGSVLGVDIGTSSIKMAEISQKGNHFKLDNYGILETKNYIEHPNQALQTSSLKLVEKDAIELLRTLIREMKPRTRTALVAIPAFSSFVAPIDMPALSPEETSRAINFQAKQYVPLPLSEVSLDWLKVEDFQTERGERYQRILLIGIPNDIVRRYKNILRGAGLHVRLIEIESLALIRSFLGFDDKLTLTVDIGAEATNIVISEKGVLKYNGGTDYGGIHLTQALSRGLGITASRAEELKRKKGLLGRGGELELSTLLIPFLDVIIQECRHVKDVYERRYGRSVEKLFLTGGGANMPGLEKYFSEEINLPLLVPPPLSGVLYPPDLEPALSGLNNYLLVALGIARRYFQ